MFLNFYNQKLHSQPGNDIYVFDTLATSMIMTNLDNTERVQSILNKLNVVMGYYRRLVFTNVDPSRGVEIVSVDMGERMIHVHTSHTVFKYTEQFTVLLNQLTPLESDFTLREIQELNLSSSEQICEAVYRIVSRKEVPIRKRDLDIMGLTGALNIE
jgi:ribosomal silencing factor RsfS